MEAACKDDSVLAFLQPEAVTMAQDWRLKRSPEVPMQVVHAGTETHRGRVSLRALGSSETERARGSRGCEKAGSLSWWHGLTLWADAKAHHLHHGQGAAATVSACTKATKWDKAIEILKNVRNLNLEPNLVTYNALAKAQQWQEVVNLFSIMQSTHIKADEVSCTSLIHRLGCSSLWLKAALFFRESRARGVICDVVSCNSAMSACDAAFVWSCCLDVFEDLKCSNIQTNVLAFNTILSACGRMDLWESTLASLQHLALSAGLGLEPTLVTRSVVMSACTFVGQWAVALHQMSCLTFRHFEDFGLRNVGNMAICSVGISACALGSLWEKALSLCSAASYLKGKVKVRSFNDAIAACGRNWQWQGALWLLSTAEERDTVTYTAAITACGQSQRWQHALLLFSALRASNLEVTTISYNSIITALGAKWQEAFQLLEELCVQQQAPDTITFGACAASACRDGQWEATLQLIDRFYKEGHQAEAVTFTAAIDACGAASYWQFGLVLLSQLDGKDILAHNAAISACGDTAQWQIALQLLHEVKSDASVSSLKLVFTSGIAACRGHWQHALQLLADMQEIPLPANLFAYNAVLGACDQAGQWLQAVFLFQELCDEDLQADMISFCSALGACRQSPGAWQYAIPFSNGLRDQLVKLLDFRA